MSEDDEARAPQVAEATGDGLRIECPGCHEKYRVVSEAGWRDGQTLTLELKFEPGAAIAASTVGEAILNMEKLMKAVAKEIGVNVVLFIEEIRLEGHELSIRFLEAKGKSPKRPAVRSTP